MFIHFVQAYFKILLVGDSLLIFYVKISESCKCAGMRFHCANGLVVLRGVVLKKRCGNALPTRSYPTAPFWFWSQPNSSTKYRSDALTRKKILWFSQSI